MRFFIAFLLILIGTRNWDVSIIGFALFLCAWSISDNIDRAISLTEDVKNRLMSIEKQLEKTKEKK